MGYPLDDFLRLAGFDPATDELDRVGRGGDASQPGGDGLLVLTFWTDAAQTEKQGVIVCKVTQHAVIRPRGALLGNQVTELTTAPGEPAKLKIPAGFNGTVSVEAYGAGGGG